MTLQRCEIWSDYQCASGTRQAVVPLDHLIALRTTERTSREDSGEVQLSKEAASYAYFVQGNVLRLLDSSGSFEEFRIQSVSDESARSRIVTATLRTPLMELATGSAILSQTTSLVTTVALEWKALTPSAILTKILTFCPAWWSAGTVTPTIPVNLAPSGWMPLQALRELVSAVRSQGVDCELTFRRNGTSGYYLDLVGTIGSSATALDVRTAKNLLGTTRTLDRDRYALEVVPLGTGNATMARAYFEVTNKASTTLTVQQPVVGGSMIAYDGQLDGYYLVDDAGARQAISSSLAAGTFVVASAANVTSGRWYRVTADSSGTDLIRHRKAPATSGPVQVLRSSALDGTTNLSPNPAMRVWTGAASAAPDSWTKVTAGHTLTRTTTDGLWVYGGQSCRCQCTLITSPAICLDSPTFNIYVPAYATSVTWSAWVYVATTAANPAVIFTRDGSAQSTTSLAAVTTGVWARYDFTQSLSGLTGSVRSFKVSLTFQAVGVGDVYVDAVQVSFDTSAQSFTEGSNPSRLLSLANRYLAKFSTVPAIYSIQFADLQAWDGPSFPYDTVTLGQTANVRDTDLGFTTSARVLELTRDRKNPLSSTITVATRPDDLITLLSGLAA